MQQTVFHEPEEYLMHDILYRPLPGAETRSVTDSLFEFVFALEHDGDIQKELPPVESVVWHIYQNAQSLRAQSANTWPLISIDDLRLLASNAAGIDLPEEGSTTQFYTEAATWLAALWNDFEQLRVHRASPECRERIKKFVIAWLDLCHVHAALEHYERHCA